MPKRPKQKIIVVVGPTASGKSDLAVALARNICLDRPRPVGRTSKLVLGGEVISADSRQVYRGLNIGSGKITSREMRGIPHHLLDVANPKQTFTASDFKQLAQKKISEIIARNHIPIIVGGTGLYIDVLLDKMSIPEVPPNVKLRKQLEKKSAVQLYALLKRIDPKRARTIEKQNPRRLIRAIEIARALGAVPAAKKSAPRYDILWLGILPADDVIKKNIAKRLTKRIRMGMIAEVRRLHSMGLSWKRLYDLGLEYRYVSLYLRGELTKKEMVAELETAIWQYARRQKTWFKKNKEIQWFTSPHAKEIKKEVSFF